MSDTSDWTPQAENDGVWRPEPAGVNAMCAECGAPVDLEKCEHRVEGIADAPDGLPAPILVCVCTKCARLSKDER